MRKFLLFAAGAGIALLMSACSTTALYENVKTEEAFRHIKDTNAQDLGIKTVFYSYRMTGNAKVDAMTVSMMFDDRLKITYSKNGKELVTFIMNKDRSCRIDAGKKAVSLTPQAAAALKFFYDINFKDPVKTAKYISLRGAGSTAEGKEKDKKAYYIFDIEPKEIYGLDKVTLKVNTKTRYIEGLDLLYPDDAVVVSNTYKNVTVRSGLTVAEMIESSFYGEKAFYKLNGFAVNRSVKAEDFNVPVLNASTEKK